MPSLRRLVPITLLLATLCAIAPSPASAAECWKDLVDDYWADGRVDGTYPISCYREAITSLPQDVQEYSDAPDDLRRALLAAIQDDAKTDEGSAEPATEPAPPPVEDGAAPRGAAGQALEKLGPKNADSIPVQLLVLGALALMLVGAAGVSYLRR